MDIKHCTIRSTPRLPLRLRLAYGVGHVLNDLCASMWFSYMLLYMKNVAGLSALNAGAMILIGQVADAIATPFVGFESDKTVGAKYGRRKTWHLAGVICVAASFPFIFNRCISCARAPQFALMIYYTPFIVLFQFGWAAVQISHLALIPEMTTCGKEKVELNALRYFFTVLSNIFVYVVCFLLFELHQKGEGTGDKSQVTAADTEKFKILGITVVAFGLIFMIIFHALVQEKKQGPHVINEKDKRSPLNSRYDNESERSGTDSDSLLSIRGFLCWFKRPLFYQVGILYMMTRLVVNVSQVYTPLFVIDTLKLDAHSIAAVPGVVFLSGIPASLLSKRINSLLGLKGALFGGLVFIFGSSAWIYLITRDITGSTNPYGLQSYGIAVVLGFGGSTVSITTLAMISEMIGKHVDTAAFVYGAMSFLDKLANGGAVMIIQYFHPCKQSIICCHDCQVFYRLVMSVIPAAAAAVSVLVLASMICSPFGSRRPVDQIVDEHDESESEREDDERSCCDSIDGSSNELANHGE